RDLRLVRARDGTRVPSVRSFEKHSRPILLLREDVRRRLGPRRKDLLRRFERRLPVPLDLRRTADQLVDVVEPILRVTPERRPRLLRRERLTRPADRVL